MCCVYGVGKNLKSSRGYEYYTSSKAETNLYEGQKLALTSYPTALLKTWALEYSLPATLLA